MKETTLRTPAQQTAFLATLKQRFEQNMHRHQGLSWAPIEKKLAASAKLQTLHRMEQTGGEPDVVGGTKPVTFMDCSAESPAGRRSQCYDAAGKASRKEAKPAQTAVDCATEMGATLLSEAQYRQLQSVGEFDTTTSSWIETPPAIRARGGALFGDRRYGAVFIYHNGAQSYYSVRGFRAFVTL